MQTFYSVMSRRGLIRIITFSTALIVILTVLLAVNISRKNEAQRNLEYSYLRAFDELSMSADNISNNLRKGMYSSTLDMMLSLAYRLWQEASVAKAALAQIPIGEVSLENTNKFLSQVGNYAVSLAEKCMNGENISNEEYQRLGILLDYSEKLRDDLWETEYRLNAGELSYDGILEEFDFDESNSPSVTEGFTSFEEGFENYPTLIYDGPFSDHIMERTPLMLENAPLVDETEARTIAAYAMQEDISKLELLYEEEGKMPSYCFVSRDNIISVTKSGGYISYMLKTRQIAQPVLTADEAVNNAQNYLDKIGFPDMTPSYHETIDNVCTINFAYSTFMDDREVICYTDLIKVMVALDNGEILGIETRGYLTNHTVRNGMQINLSGQDAIDIISDRLTVNSARAALIPTESLNEVLTWEISCKAENGQTVLVYINAKTGKEEQILLLIESESGTLTV